MNERDILEKIKKSANTIDPPASLDPANMQHKLDNQTSKAKKKFPIYRMGLAAALLLTLIAVFTINKLTPTENNTPVSPQELTLGKSESQASANTESAASTPDQISALSPANSYDEIYEAIEEHFPKYQVEDTRFYSNSMAGSDKEDTISESIEDRSDTQPKEINPSAESSGALADSGTSKDYSATNLQETGVDEGDIVKTDGKYLYIKDSNQKIRIVSADAGSLEEVGTISLPSLDEHIEEFYLDNDKLSLITSSSISAMEKNTSPAQPEDTQSKFSDYYVVSSKQTVKLYTYSISDRKTPKLLGSTSQEGTYRTSRKIGDDIYTFTEYTPYLEKAREQSTYIPNVNGSPLAYDDIYLPKYMENSTYLVITSTNLGTPDKTTDKKAIVSAAYLFYVSTDNIYICNNNWTGERNTSQILKFHFENGTITPAAAGEVDGNLNNSFSLSEYKGNLRVVSTDYKDGTTINALHILDKDLTTLSKLDNLAPGETIQSARFMGNTGYFVTYRQIDPLFSVDLNDPTNPKILGELKITGFSSYLHFYGENQLLGIGYETDPETGEYKGIKLSMFDITDPANVKEVHKYIIENAHSSEGLENYKAIMINSDKNIIGLECRTDQSNYMIFSYNPNEGFKNQFLQSFESTKDYANTINNPRGIYISDTFYLTYGEANTQKIEAFNIKDEYKKMNCLNL